MKKESAKPFAVITGASSGIGYELARQFVENDYDILIAAETDEIQEAARTLAAGGKNVKGLKADLATSKGVEKLYTAIKDYGRPVDAIALNAGVGTNGDFIRENDLEDDLKLIALNVTSSVHLAKLVIGDMVKQNKGRVLFTASIAALMPGPYMATYNASKAFLLSFSQALRYELKDTDVTVTALMPGATDTNFFDRAEMQDTKLGEAKKDDPVDVARDGFEAMMAGKDMVIAHSLGSKANGLMGKILPSGMKAAMEGKEAKPGSAAH